MKGEIMSNKKKVNANRVAAYALSGVMLAGIIPYNVFASPDVTKKEIQSSITSDQGLGVSTKEAPTRVRSGETTDALSSATYYRKANWENKIKDKSRWPVGDNQRLVRVSTSDPLEMNDVNYDGAFIDANGRTVLRLIYIGKRQLLLLEFGTERCSTLETLTNTLTMTSPML